MGKFWVVKSGDDVIINHTKEGFDESLKLPYNVFQEVVEDLKAYPESIGYPIKLEVSSGVLEIPYDEFFKLVSALSSN